MDDYHKGSFANLHNIELQNLAKSKTEGISLLQQQLIQAQSRISSLQDDLSKKEQELEEAQDNSEFYRNLLCRPMHEIAAKNRNFKETYEKQMELMADWMVSQKAFKELAIQFGFDKGLSPQETIQMGRDKYDDVLDNKHEQIHGSNANDIPFLEERKDKIRNNIKEKIGKK